MYSADLYTLFLTTWRQVNLPLSGLLTVHYERTGRVRTSEGAWLTKLNNQSKNHIQNSADVENTRSPSKQPSSSLLVQCIITRWFPNVSPGPSQHCMHDPSIIGPLGLWSPPVLKCRFQRKKFRTAKHHYIYRYRGTWVVLHPRHSTPHVGLLVLASSYSYVCHGQRFQKIPRTRSQLAPSALPVLLIYLLMHSLVEHDWVARFVESSWAGRG